jgi:hypothetical protein
MAVLNCIQRCKAFRGKRVERRACFLRMKRQCGYRSDKKKTKQAAKQSFKHRVT